MVLPIFGLANCDSDLVGPIFDGSCRPLLTDLQPIPWRGRRDRNFFSKDENRRIGQVFGSERECLWKPSHCCEQEQ